MTPIGRDPLMLGVSSPQTFVSRYGGYALILDASKFVKEIISQPASILENLSNHCSRRQKQFTEQNKKQYSIHYKSERLTPEMAYKKKQDEQCK